MELRLAPAVVTTPLAMPPPGSGLTNLAAAITALNNGIDTSGILQFATGLAPLQGAPDFFVLMVPVTVQGEVNLGGLGLGLEAGGAIKVPLLEDGNIDDASSIASMQLKNAGVGLVNSNQTITGITGSGSVSVTGNGNSVSGVNLSGGTTGGAIYVTGNGNTVSGDSVGSGTATNGSTLTGKITVAGDGNTFTGLKLVTAILTITGNGNTVSGGSMFSTPATAPVGVAVVAQGNSNDFEGLTLEKVGLKISGDNNSLLNLTGNGINVSGSGITVTGSGCTVTGLVVKGLANDSDSVYVGGPAGGTVPDNDVVQGAQLTNCDLLLSGNSTSLMNSTVKGGQVLVTATGSGVVVQNDTILAGPLHGYDALLITGDHTMVSGNVVAGSTQGPSGAISLEYASHDSVIENNWIGTTDRGKTASGDGVGIGIAELAAYPGSASNITIRGNLISGNTRGVGIVIHGGTGYQIVGNTIGLDAGGQPLPNAAGIDVFADSGALGTQGPQATIGGASPALGNVISGNLADGIILTSNNNVVENNWIGTNKAGTKPEGNASSYGAGIEVDGSGNTIGAPGAGNIIAGNSSDGIDISGDNNLVQNNYIGTNPSSAALGNQGAGVLVQGNGNTIGGTMSAMSNVISCNGGDGVDIDGTENYVQYNLIGTNATGTATSAGGKSLGNVGDGISIYSSGNVIGVAPDDASGSDGNLIGGNQGDGIHIEGQSATDNVVAGNVLGVSADGGDPLGNQGNGIAIIDASDNTIGGPNENDANVICNSAVADQVGVAIAAASTSSSPSSQAAVAGPMVAAANPPAGTKLTGNGVFIEVKASRNGGQNQASNNSIVNDYIGITPAGHKDRNAGDGVLIYGGSKNTIGGTTPNLRDYISGNGNAGARMLTGPSGATPQYNIVEGDYIGTDTNGKVPLIGPNPLANMDGVVIDGGSNNTIGAFQQSSSLMGMGNTSLPVAASNIIAGNMNDGVVIAGTGTGNRLSLNLIFANQRMGIEFANYGIVAPSNTRTAPPGPNSPNNLQNYPILTSILDAGSNANIIGTLTPQGVGPYWIEFYANQRPSSAGNLSEGQWFLGAASFPVGPDGLVHIAFSATIPGVGSIAPYGVVTDHLIAATATDANGNTSEFSPCRDILRDAVANPTSQTIGAANLAALKSTPSIIAQVFVPNAVLGSTPTLTVAAQDCGVDHFNWLQYMTLPAGWKVELVGYGFVSGGALSNRMLDPIVNSPTFHYRFISPNGDAHDTPPFYFFTDVYPWYWNDIDLPAPIGDLSNLNLSFNVTRTVLRFDDQPSSAPLTFQTSLVGVQADHVSSSQWAGLRTAFSWQSDATNSTFLTYTQTGSGIGATGPSIVYGGVYDVQFGDAPPNPSAVDHLVVSAPAAAAANGKFNITVTAQDGNGNTDAAYNGWVALGLHYGPANGILSGAAVAPVIGGTATFTNLSLNLGGTYSLVAGSDIGQSAIASLTVAPAPQFKVIAATTPTAAGQPVNVTVTALNPQNQPYTTYQGTIQLTTTDPQAIFPAGDAVTFTPQDQGSVTVQAIFGTAGSQTITATDNTSASAKGISASVKVTPGPVAQLVVTAVAPLPGVIGAKEIVTVTVEDQDRNRVNNFGGTVSFSVNGGTANLPGSYPFTSADNGAHTFAITPTSMGSVTLKVTDGTNNGSLPLTVVSAATHLTVSVSSPGPVVAGTPFTITVTALDAGNRPDLNFADQLHFASAGGLTLDQAFTSTTGSEQFTVTLTKSGSQIITVSDTNRPAITGKSPVIAVTAVASQLVVTPASSAPAMFGLPYPMKITAEDQYGNPAPSYRGTIQLSVTGGSGSVPTSLTLNSASGTFSLTPQSLGSLTVKATDGTNGGSLPTTVVSAATHLAITGVPATITAGTPFTITVSALTASGRPAVPFQDGLHFADMADATGLPADAAFTGTNGQEQFTITLPNAGAQTVTVSDLSVAGVKAASVMLKVQAANNGITPAVQISGSAVGVPGQPLTFTVTANETGTAVDAVYTYHLDWLGNGKSVQTVQGPGSGTAVTHVYPATGSFTIKVSATDLVGDTGTPASAPLSITTTALENDPATGTDTALAIGCATTGSTVVITPTNAAGTTIAVSITGVAQTLPSQPFTSILVFGQAGTDTMTEKSSTVGGQTTLINLPAFVFGGTGTNTLSAAGSMANNVLIGGTGKNTLTGSVGRDILIGGGGAATLNAGSGDDIVIAGSTSYDTPTVAHLSALVAMMAEWQRTDIDYAQRVQDLSGSGSGGVNGAFVFDPQTVSADTTPNQLVAGAGSDWFWISVSPQKFDQIAGYQDGEFVSEV